MPRVELIKDYAGLPKGTIKELPHMTANTLVREGNGRIIAEKQDKEPVQTKELKSKIKNK